MPGQMSRYAWVWLDLWLNNACEARYKTYLVKDGSNIPFSLFASQLYVKGSNICPNTENCGDLFYDKHNMTITIYI